MRVTLPDYEIVVERDDDHLPFRGHLRLRGKPVGKWFCRSGDALDAVGICERQIIHLVAEKILAPVPRRLPCDRTPGKIWAEVYGHSAS